MKYIDVEWKHQNIDEPTRLVLELDHHRCEIRKLEFFLDGKVGFATQYMNSPGTELSSTAIPPLAEVNQSSEFNGVCISAQIFESLWAAHAPVKA
ncbi:DUF6881 domain-containing protein [Xanthomonas arboricola]|uniref:DUF6881 domain-containing protein n=1 Tax=Xanthomonas arboricola TaxID=56448 RepID=UPI00161A4624|nr:hypothetical protein [Xanthomonas arboricola]MBB5858679.1 hypothetical protein [Xanthomonas arboricola]UOS99434.1 hypothetical protein LZZ50_03395 [Xanthomonas arboricola]